MMVPIILTLLSVTSPKSSSLAKVMSHCYRIASSRDFRLSGTIKVKLKITKSGKVQRIFILKDTTKSKPLIKCVKYQLFKKNFALKDGVTFQFKFPKIRRQYSVWSHDVPITRGIGKLAASRVILDKKSSSVKKISLSVIRISKGGNLPLRFHPFCDTFIYIINGTGTFQWGKSITRTGFMPISPGSSIFIPKNAVYSIKGSSDPPLVALVFHTPLGPELYYSSLKKDKNTIIIPKNGMPKNAKYKPDFKAGTKLKFKTININTFLRRKTSKIILKGKKSYLGIVKLLPKGKVKIKNKNRSEMVGFSLKGGGILKIKGEKWPIQPGSGFIIPSSGIFTSMIKNIPFYAVWVTEKQKPKFKLK